MPAAPGTVLLAGIVGSTAYGFAHAGSDIDRLGLFATPTEELHGLHRPAESHVTTRPDATLHEAAKWCRLALSCNPTASELVWLPDDLYDTRTPLGDELIGIRSSFLSAPAVRRAYLGYADQQLRKLSTRDTADATSRRRAAKHARHLARLVEQAVRLHETGTNLVRLPDPERIRDLGERIADDPAAARPLLAAAADRLDHPGVLPAAPDPRPAEAWLRRVRAAHYTPPSASPAPARPPNPLADPWCPPGRIAVALPTRDGAAGH
ncbi:nucleotidyltransferase domain-containing protein [Streptomyces sp. SP17BM10]|uniref:nucleotidyltransferase domain-containing protein n=1 Tax=Streptomyces sp. SP17BM10 TaxID=3002530 RepID=UPI002E77748A|nr:nucleotidyltransferase domain-containing protein [Streptomyces sp. SP17BM10]MEE1785662.1 nucleotidyltransferase domain-containing protein [Streptomyces sp. SP17BM10]